MHRWGKYLFGLGTKKLKFYLHMIKKTKHVREC